MLLQKWYVIAPMFNSHLSPMADLPTTFSTVSKYLEKNCHKGPVINYGEEGGGNKMGGAEAK